MKVKVDATHHFKQRLKKFKKKKPQVMGLLENAVSLLTQTEYPPQSLKIHKLKGSLKECYAFSLTHDLRVVFSWEGGKIILNNIGSHDEVY